MSRDFGFFIDDMRVACRKIIRHTKGFSREKFFKDDKTFDAVMRNLEIIGEAAKHIPEGVRKKNSRIAWRKISGLRDVVIHEYFGIDHDIIWSILIEEIPTLLKELNEISVK
jgi:uncharacterized protein with HEPN domain